EREHGPAAASVVQGEVDHADPSGAENMSSTRLATSRCSDLLLFKASPQLLQKKCGKALPFASIYTPSYTGSPERMTNEHRAQTAASGSADVIAMQMASCRALTANPR